MLQKFEVTCNTFSFSQEIFRIISVFSILPRKFCAKCANRYNCLQKFSFQFRNLLFTHKTFSFSQETLINLQNLFSLKHFSFSQETLIQTFRLLAKHLCSPEKPFYEWTQFLEGTECLWLKVKAIWSFFPLITYTFASCPFRRGRASSYHHGNKYIYLMAFYGLLNSGFVRLAK